MLALLTLVVQIKYTLECARRKILLEQGRKSAESVVYFLIFFCSEDRPRFLHGQKMMINLAFMCVTLYYYGVESVEES